MIHALHDAAGHGGNGEPIPAAPPRLGNDTDEILASLGIQEAERIRLRAAGIV